MPYPFCELSPAPPRAQTERIPDKRPVAAPLATAPLSCASSTVSSRLPVAPPAISRTPTRSRGPRAISRPPRDLAFPHATSAQPRPRPRRRTLPIDVDVDARDAHSSSQVAGRRARTRTLTPPTAIHTYPSRQPSRSLPSASRPVSQRRHCPPSACGARRRPTSASPITPQVLRVLTLHPAASRRPQTGSVLIPSKVAGARRRPRRRVRTRRPRRKGPSTDLSPSLEYPGRSPVPPPPPPPLPPCHTPAPTYTLVVPALCLHRTTLTLQPLSLHPTIPRSAVAPVCHPPSGQTMSRVRSVSRLDLATRKEGSKKKRGQVGDTLGTAAIAVRAVLCT
ncbi:hypothetical protein C8Q78DRAFT_668035 [Trametes maxima]|nr:hypothetical protein C8Q78DRAFT_668035 [Trametes maxima]